MRDGVISNRGGSRGSPKLNLPRLIFFDNATKIPGYGTSTQVDILKV